MNNCDKIELFKYCIFIIDCNMTLSREMKLTTSVLTPVKSKLFFIDLVSG